MSSVSDSTRITRPQLEAEPLRWRSWPLWDHHWRTLAGVAALICLGWLVQWITGRVYLGAFAVVLILLALGRQLLPTVYELTEEGIRCTVVGRSQLFRWSCIRHHEVVGKGVLLWEEPFNGPLDYLRAVYIPWGDYREELLAAVERRSWPSELSLCAEVSPPHD